MNASKVERIFVVWVDDKVKKCYDYGRKLQRTETVNNIYDSAYQLEKDLRELPAFTTLTETYNKVKEDPEAWALFQEFASVQQEMQMKQMSGEEFSEDYVQRAQDVANRATTNEEIAAMMNAEQQLSMVIQDINNIIMKPLQELYAPAQESEAGDQ